MNKYEKGLQDGIEIGKRTAVTHGRWTMSEYEYFDCSACGWSYNNGCNSTSEAKRRLQAGDCYRYCPNCGAKMDLEEST